MQTINAISILCAYHAQNLKLIARCGAVPLLVRILAEGVPLQPLAVQLVLAIAMTQEQETRHMFISQGGVECLISVLDNKELTNWTPMVLSALGGLYVTAALYTFENEYPRSLTRVSSQSSEPYRTGRVNYHQERTYDKSGTFASVRYI